MKGGVYTNMAIPFLFTLMFLFGFSSAMGRGNQYPTSLFSGESKASIQSELQTYIVHVKQPESIIFTQSEDRETWYRSFLPVGVAGSNEQQRMVYSYQNVISGFAARLTKEEVKAMENKDGFVSAHPDRMLPLHTTHTPNFLGLHQEMGFWNQSNFGKGVIVGVLDTGVFPSHPSFSDEGMPPPPAKWKGRCDFNASDCNNKIIGARSFTAGAKAMLGGVAAEDPPIDKGGHGTHTASTAAGGFVQNVDVLGNAKGTAVGMAPYAHLAIYKVCSGGCFDSDILAGLDTAVEDGVDVLSLSLGGGSIPFYEDSIAVGAFGAIQKGIFVSCSAGNGGPLHATLSNEAPWILTVGASTIDRSIRATAKLGNGEEFNGESLFQPEDFSSTLLPLVYAGMNGKPESAFCLEGSFNDTDVTGKVVLCERGGGGGGRIAKGAVVKSAGGAAMILMNDEVNGFSTLADAHVLPATHVSFSDGQKIKAYINSSSTPVATIEFKGTVIGMSSAPAITSFSSRGPSEESIGILKPDITGPGVSILAAWPFPLDNNTNSKATFNIISGTSMSCPHLSGIAALLKSSHPDWSPAAIKSAIMTTADILDMEGKPIVDQRLNPADVYATGAGHVNPSKANDPGLVYDIQPDDYIPYLCGLGYTSKQVGVIAHRPIECSNETSISEGELNYPSFSVINLGRPSQTFTRTVTNVGEASSSYTVEISSPQGIDVTVNPEKLDFSEVNQKMSYTVTFTRTSSDGPSSFAQGFVNWVSSKQSVKSPFAIILD